MHALIEGLRSAAQPVQCGQHWAPSFSGGSRGPGGPCPPKRYERNFFSNEPLDNVVGNVNIFSARFARDYSTHIQYKAVLNLPNLVMIF
jgi:hypothetical protein